MSSYEHPEHPELVALAARMRDYYAIAAGPPTYWEQAAAGNRDWTASPLHGALLRRLRANDYLVEFSCGNAHARLHFERSGVRYVGFDLNAHALSVAAGGTRGFAADAYRTPLRSASADWAVSLYALEHVVWPARYLGEMLRVVKPRGRLALLFPDFLADPRRTLGSMRFGRSELGIRDKLARGRWWDAMQSFAESRLIYRPRVRRMIRTARRGRLRFTVNTCPACLIAPYCSDSDAIHFASEHEVCVFLEARGCTIEVRSADVPGAPGGNALVIAQRG